MNRSTFLKIVISGLFLFTTFFVVSPHSAHADVLDPNNPITSCGEMASPGTYTLGADIDVGSSTPCIIISSDGVTIDPAGYTLTGNITLQDNGGGSPTYLARENSGPWNGTRTWTVNNSSILTYSSYPSYVYGDVTFNDISTSQVYIDGNETFNNDSHAVNVFLRNGSGFFNDNSYLVGFSNTESTPVNLFFNQTSSYLPSIEDLAVSEDIQNKKNLYYLPNVSGKIWINSIGDSDWDNAQNWIGGVPSNSDNIILATSTTLSKDLTNNVYIIKNSVVINGNGHTITGNINGDGRDEQIVTNIFPGYAGGRTSLKSPAIDGYSYTLLDTNVIGNLSSVGGFSSSTSVRVGGNITISNSNLNLSNSFINTNGTLTVDYNTLNHTGTILGALSHIIINGQDKGPYAGGSWPSFLIPGTITECGLIDQPGTYTLGSNISGDCVISAPDVIIDGGTGNFTLTGTITSSVTSTSTLTVSNMTVTGAVSSLGSVGDVVISNATTGNVSSDGKVTVQNNSNVGDIMSTGDVSIKGNSIAGDISIVGASGETETESESETSGGSTGASEILVDNSTVGSIATGASTGGESESESGGASGAGQIIIRNNAQTGLINVGTYLWSVLVTDSSVGVITSTGGNITLTNSQFGNTLACAPLSGDTSADGCSIVLSSTNLDLTNKTIAAGYLYLNYSGISTNNNTRFRVIHDLVINDESQGPFSPNYAATYNPVIFYYNNATGDGDWGNLNNWWNSANFTGDHPLSLPSLSDTVFISGNVTQNTSGYEAVGSTITFTGTSTNSIEILSSVNTVFADSSTNAGTVLGDAIFKGDLSNDNGVVQGQVDQDYIFTQRTSSGQHQWTSITSSVDGTKLAATDGNGYIYTSTDSGATWTEQVSSGQRAWQSITSSSDGTKLAAAASGDYIYTSTDSGATWTEQVSSGQRAWQSITSSSDGTKLAAAASGDYIYTSTDSGATWTTNNDSSGQRNWISITSSSDGTKLAAAASGDYIYTSTDSGATWAFSYSTYSNYWRSITSSSDGSKLAAVAINNSIFTSTDSGVSWTIYNNSSGQRAWYSITSSSDGTKLIAGVQYGNIYTSSDGGFTWVERTSAGQRGWYSITSSADGTKLAVGDNSNGYIYTYDKSNGGISRFTSTLTRLYTSSVQTIRNFSGNLAEGARNDWTIISKGINTVVDLTNAVYDIATNYFKSLLGGLFISNPNNQTNIGVGRIWTKQISSGNSAYWNSITSSADGTKLAAVDGIYYGNGYIYTSNNSGVTWVQQTSAGQHVWQSIASSADGTKLAAVASGNNAYLYTSTDSGVTWTEQTSLGQHPWSSITSSADGTKLAAAGGANYNVGYIYTSADSGATWIEQTSSGSRLWRSIVSSADGTKLAAVTGNSYIYTSTDSGDTWTEQISSDSRNWTSITSSSDGSKLAAVTGNSYIYTSTDSGVTWTEQTSSGQHNWYSITSSSDGSKLAAAADYIYISTDSGVTWTRQTSSGSRIWSSIVSSADGTKLAAGTLGDFIHTSSAIDATGLPVVSQPVVTSPISKTTGNTLRWNPSINWDGATKCEYKIDNGSYTVSTCSLNGSDIPKPLPGDHTLSIRATNITGGITENSVNFNYDVTSPIDTDCSTPLSESSRQYYYLLGPTTGTCTITANNITLKGNGYTLTGDVVAPGLNVNLENITVTGSISSNGVGNSVRGGTIRVTNGTTGSISSNGSNGTGKGGNGGTILLTNSQQLSTNSIITSNGGNSTSCGDGGDSGTVTLADSTYSNVVSNAGSGSNLTCPSISRSAGTTRAPIITSVVSRPSAPAANSSPAPARQGGGSTATRTVTPTFTPGTLSPITLPTANIGRLTLPTLPTFGGTSSSSFSFASPLANFLFKPLPAKIQSQIKDSPTLQSLLKSKGIIYEKDVAQLGAKPLPLIDTTDLFTITDTKGKSISSTLTLDKGNMLTQKISIKPNTKITVSFNNTPVDFSKSSAGTYTLKAPNAPLNLTIVIEKNTPSITTELDKPKTFIQKVLGWFGWR